MALKRALMLAMAAAAALLLTTAPVLATPGSGITPVDLARGTSAAAYTITTEANRDIATQTLTFAAGGTSTSGWHTHPGPVVTIVQSGTMSIWFSSDCTLRTVTAGQAIVVPGAGVFDLARNEDAAVPLILVQTYYNVPVGGALRTDAPTPQCSSATPAVPQDMAVVGVTAVNHSRVRLASALSITGAANTDLMIQQLTIAPGATTGWHSHPGPVTVAVESGALTFVHNDCTTTPYPAGTGFLDPGAGNVHQATSAGASTAFVTYTNLPMGGAARIDHPAPACAAPAPAAAAATPAPAATAAPGALPNTSTPSEAVGAAGYGTGLLALTGVLAIGCAGLVLWRRRSA